MRKIITLGGLLLATLSASAQWNSDSTVFRVTDLQT